MLVYQDTFVFGEVRLLNESNWVGALASINTSKQNKIYKTPQHYLQPLYRARDYPPCRFDVIAIKDGQLQWLKAAF